MLSVGSIWKCSQMVNWHQRPEATETMHSRSDSPTQQACFLCLFAGEAHICLHLCICTFCLSSHLIACLLWLPHARMRTSGRGYVCAGHRISGVRNSPSHLAAVLIGCVLLTGCWRAHRTDRYSVSSIAFVKAVLRGFPAFSHFQLLKR